MHIGVPKEVKTHEYRVGLTPASVRELTGRGHEVIVERGAGDGIGFGDADYLAAGAKIAASATQVWGAADLVVKVKEPQPGEYGLLREGQVVFTYLHLAPDPRLAEALLSRGSVAIAYETVTDDQGGLPLLVPMSMVAGRMAPQVGAYALLRPQGGRGVLLPGVPGAPPGKVTVVGAGTVGRQAARIAAALGAEVTVLDLSAEKLAALAPELGEHGQVAVSTVDTLEQALTEADLVIGAVLVPGGAAPKLIRRDMLARMKRGAVIVDVAIDQGGCCETSRPTTHEAPTYVVDGVVHYCVTNMPGAVPLTATLALNDATLPYVLALAEKGWEQALRDDPQLRAGLNICAGQLTYPAVATALGRVFVPPEQLL